MNAKRQRAYSLIVCMLYIFITFTSLFYIAKEEEHHCTGEDCPICACIHQAEQTLKNLGTGTISTINVLPISMLSALILVTLFLFAFCTSLVSQKVRLNN